MFSERILYNVQNSSVIRKLFMDGKELADRVGAENVSDYSLGNPVAPVPQEFTDAMLDLIQNEDGLYLHGYMPNAGYPEVRQAIAENLNKRFGSNYTATNIIMTVGAGGALNVVMKALLNIDDEVIAFCPYFGEYDSYVSNWYGKVVGVLPDYSTFYPDMADFERKISPRTKAVIINNPNNPTGVIYPPAVIRQITDIMERKQKEYGHEIFLVSDEPYREVVYDGEKTEFLPDYYDNTFITYSFSKALSIPGERIGYLAIPTTLPDVAHAADVLTVSNRVCGYINAPSLMQLAVARCLDVKCDVDYYDRNRKKLYNALVSMGYECVKPQGAFYMFMKSPEPDEHNFVAKMKEQNVIVVPASGFYCPGYLRLAYCTSPEVIERSLPGFARVAEYYGLKAENPQLL